MNRDGIISTDGYFELLYRLFSTSQEIDRIVLLALDAVYSPKTGILNEKRRISGYQTDFYLKRLRN
ncbi:MAG: hypothetical protein QMC83_07870 [Thermodesulfovibrionales bacterium]|nr:hypothetical protein [Thermodesulfovibrionales bacterium]